MKQKKLKITAEWTEDVYYSRRNEHTDDLDKVEVNGWLVRINGKK